MGCESTAQGTRSVLRCSVQTTKLWVELSQGVYRLGLTLSCSSVPVVSWELSVFSFQFSVAARSPSGKLAKRHCVGVVESGSVFGRDGIMACMVSGLAADGQRRSQAFPATDRRQACPRAP